MNNIINFPVEESLKLFNERKYGLDYSKYKYTIEAINTIVSILEENAEGVLDKASAANIPSDFILDSI